MACNAFHRAHQMADKRDLLRIPSTSPIQSPEYRLLEEILRFLILTEPTCNANKLPAPTVETKFLHAEGLDGRTHFGVRRAVQVMVAGHSLLPPPGRRTCPHSYVCRKSSGNAGCYQHEF